jgi:hypothetical protein
MFTDTEIASILSDFPKFELSYETMTHKKVFNHNVVLAIPDGKKCLAWFTSYKAENVCFIMETTENNGIENIYIVRTGFSDKLVLGESGTILYGTTFRSSKSSPCFCIEDLYYYKGTNYSGRTFVSRLQLLKTILQTELSQNALTNSYTVFGLPLMNTDLLTLLKEIELLPYRVKYLKYRWFETKKIMCAEYYKPNARINDVREREQVKIREPNVKLLEPLAAVKQLSTAVFKVTTDIQSDIYNLFIRKDGKEEFYDYAFIPDYETSVLMNKLFRNIKENDNLDALEESDDEDEFENDRADKYVYLDRDYKMNCKYNYKLKKWMPVLVAKESDQIVSHNLLTSKI